MNSKLPSQSPKFQILFYKNSSPRDLYVMIFIHEFQGHGSYWNTKLIKNNFLDLFGCFSHGGPKNLPGSPKRWSLSSVKQKLFQSPAVLIMNGLYNTFFWTNPRAKLIFVFWFFQDHSGPCLTKAYMVQTSINCVNNKENPRCCRHQSLHSVSLMVHWIEKVFRNNFSFYM